MTTLESELRKIADSLATRQAEWVEHHCVAPGDREALYAAVTMGEAANALAAKGAEIGRITRERDELYRIALAATNATDGAAVHGVSIEFLSHLPEEVAAIKSQRDAARAELAECRNKALEEAAEKVDRMQYHWRDPGTDFAEGAYHHLGNAARSIRNLKTGV